MTRHQCHKCPWKMDVDPGDIPDGFNYEMHRTLGEDVRRTSQLGSDELYMMACHETPSDGLKQKPCVGWLVQQMGPGNNIVLRLRAMRDRDFANVKTIGMQRSSFDDIWPNTHDDPACTHPKTKPGQRVAHGRLEALRTEICCRCGAFRTTNYFGNLKSFWRPWNEYVALIEREESERT